MLFRSHKSSLYWRKSQQVSSQAIKLLQDELNNNLLQDKLKQREDPQTRLKLGKLYIKIKEYDKAEECLLKAIDQDGELVDIHTNLGVLYTQKEYFDKAVQYFKSSLRIKPEDLNVISNLAEAYFKLEQLTKSESEYRRVLSITAYHVESHIGLGEVYTAIGDNGEADIYSQAISHFDEAIKISNSGEGSKRLKPKELAAVKYSRGYAKIKLYETSGIVKDQSLLSAALDDFRDCVKQDPENYKAKRAIEKLEKQTGILSTQSLTELIGTLFILLPSLFILIITQFVFWKPFLVQKAEEIPPQVSQIKKDQKTPIKVSQVGTKINTTEYFLLTFGSLTFSLISLYLPQLLKLKIGGTGIEIEKSSVDQIKVTTPLGITK